MLIRTVIKTRGSARRLLYAAVAAAVAGAAIMARLPERTSADPTGTSAAPQIEWLQLGDIGRSSRAAGIAAGPDDTLYVVGGADVGAAGAEPDGTLFLAQYDTSGKRLWHRFVRAPGTSDGTGIAVDAAGNAYVVGTERREDDVAGILVPSFSPAGQRRWLRRFGRTGYAERAYAMDVGGGQVVVAGEALDRGPAGAQTCIDGYGGLAVAVSTEGQPRWARQVLRTRPGDAYGKAVVLGPGGDGYYGMREVPCGGEPRVVLTRFDSEGVPTARIEIPPLTDLADASSMGGLVLAGQQTDRLGRSQAVIVKVTSGVKWFRRLESPRSTDIRAVTAFRRQWLVAAGSTADANPADAVITQYNGNGKFILADGTGW